MPGNRKWTEDEIARLRLYHAEGYSVRETARRLRRTATAVRFKSHILEIFWRDGRESLRVRVKRLEEALVFYADPDTYCAISFLPDPPCGEFINDVSEVDADYGYNRPMPGARARRALAVGRGST